MTQKTGLGVLGLASGSVVAGEVLLTRLLSVCTWYGLAFLVLSIAMLGMTSGSLSAARAHQEGKPLAEWVAQKLVLFSFGLVLATARPRVRGNPVPRLLLGIGVGNGDGPIGDSAVSRQLGHQRGLRGLERTQPQPFG